jgi:hypothetical protein
MIAYQLPDPVPYAPRDVVRPPSRRRRRVKSFKSTDMARIEAILDAKTITPEGCWELKGDLYRCTQWGTKVVTYGDWVVQTGKNIGLRINSAVSITNGVWLHLTGEALEADEVIIHTCGNPLCFNPRHMKKVKRGSDVEH